MFQTIKHIHFSGICGTAMASLAVLIKNRGYQVSGSDANVYPPMSTYLENCGIFPLEGYRAENLQPKPDLVVIGNALSRRNAEVETCLEQKIQFISMAELLKDFFIRGRNSLVVSGTHGKTTTTSLLAWVFEAAGRKPGFLIGGIAENFAASCKDGAGEYFITEGDEYDTAFFDKRSKFLHYLPDQLLINNIEFDHADIFDTLQDIIKSFRFLLRLVPKNGLIVANGDDANVLSLQPFAFAPWVTFGTGDNNQVRISNIRSQGQGTAFDLNWQGKEQVTLSIPLLGEHNVRNVTGVYILARHHQISVASIQQGLDQFIGVKRRLELKGEPNKIAIYDDFAHHPTAILETLKALRFKHPKQKIYGVFEPRSNTSVLKVHEESLSRCFQPADAVVLAYPHRMDKIPLENRLDVDAVVARIRKDGQSAEAFKSVAEIVDYLQKNAQPGDVILIMSNGKFDNIHQLLITALTP